MIALDGVGESDTDADGVEDPVVSQGAARSGDVHATPKTSTSAAARNTRAGIAPRIVSASGIEGREPKQQGMNRLAVRRSPVPRALALAVVLASLSGALSVAPVAAAPRAPKFGPVIEDYASHVEPERCRPKDKPGVKAFADLLLAEYGPAWIGIGRPCDGEATSDHHEGRALDWGRDVHARSDRRAVRDLFDWLFEIDRYDNTDALARRLGIVYIIWNRRIWGGWSGEWSVYCVKKPAGCRDPDSKYLLNPHTDHVHISFDWAGARMRTTFWDPESSQVD